MRHEGFYQDTIGARNRQRLRLRFGARVQVSDELEGGIRLVSGDPNEIIANNQTLTDVFTRKPINIDNAYITIRPGKTLGLEKPFFSITGGKFSVPFFRPRAIMGSELLFDEDLTPEGLAEEITLLEGKEGAVSAALSWPLGSGLLRNSPLSVMPSCLVNRCKSPLRQRRKCNSLLRRD